MIAILGKIPPPIGGVTIHVSRLIERLKLKSEINFIFINLSLINLLKFSLSAYKYDKVHLHSSNPKIRLFVVLLGKLHKTKVIVTFHGDIGRHKKNILNHFDLLSIKHSFIPILLNDNSLKKALKYNKFSKKITSFIAPNLEKEQLCSEISSKILNLKSNVRLLFSTNAYNYSIDKYGNEIYGIYEIIDFFSKNNTYGLVFSDPSGAYTKKFEEDNLILPENILIINELHSYFSVMSLCDITIRNTTTDGDSISVRESLYLKKPVLCTDVVNRPNGCLIYHKGELTKTILNLNLTEIQIKDNCSDAIDELLHIYLL